MNTANLRRKRVVIPAIATVAVLGVGATVWTATADGQVDGAERDRVGAAAVEAVGGGTVIDVEKSDDAGEAYDVEVRLDDGTETDVVLDENLDVVSQDADDRIDDRDDGIDDRDDGIDDRDDGIDDRIDDRDDRDRPDADDRALSATEIASAEKAALRAVGGGTVIRVEASDDGVQAYEVEVRDSDNAEWDVDLDATFKVLDKTLDR